MIVFDENVDQALIDRLNAENYKVFSVKAHQPGISDRQVIEIAKSKKGIVITEDKDFGELVFSHNIRDCSVILLRYDKPAYEQIEKNVITVLKDHYDKPEHFFITITKKKIRIRKI